MTIGAAEVAVPEGVEPLLTLPELAAALKVPVETVYRWRKRKTGPKGYRVGRGVRFKWSDVEEWLAERAS